MLFTLPLSINIFRHHPYPFRSGMLWKFSLYGNWYDSYYIGLDGIEMYDNKGLLLDVIACGATIAGN